MADGIMVPKDVHLPIPDTPEYVTGRSQRGSADVTRALAGEAILDDHRGPYRREARGSE